MKYKLYKLTFSNPVHFGGDTLGTSLEEADYICHSDTLFSALCLEYIKLYSDKTLYDDFIKLFIDGELLISSLFPYKDNDIYIPKPLYISNHDKNSDSKNNENKDRKKMKKLSYIKVRDINDYIQSIKNNNIFDYDSSYNDFAKYSLVQKVGLRTEDSNNSLYSVGAYSFKKDSGLYFILVYKDESHLNKFNSIMKSLSYSGLGGKRSSGYGGFSDNFDFDRDDSNIIMNMILKNDCSYKMLLSLYCPNDEEINRLNFNNSYYLLIKRNGFVYSSYYGSNLLKRNSICMFREGSCFQDDLSGDIKDLSNNGNHKVYRYGKALYIGINI